MFQMLRIEQLLSLTKYDSIYLVHLIIKRLFIDELNKVNGNLYV